MSDAAIGIFDSGIGGLTVFKAVRDALPGENLTYLGDTARVPYGTKSPETVLRYSRQNLRFLIEQGVKLVIVACNTASAFALESLKNESAVPLLGVIAPGVRGAVRASQSGRIGVIGTEGTIRSRAYSDGLCQARPETQVFSEACPLFVPLVEEGLWESDIAEKIAQTYLTPLLRKDIDTLILGCTHYPLLKKVLRAVAGPSVTLIDSAEEAAQEALREILSRGYQRKENGPGRSRFFVTDSPERFQRVGSLLIGGTLQEVEHVEI